MGGANDGPVVYVGVGLVGIPDVGAGAVLTSNDGTRVVAVVGLVVDDEGENVDAWGGELGVGPVVVVGTGVGSAFGSVPVGDNVRDAWEGGIFGIHIGASCIEGVAV